MRRAVEGVPEKKTRQAASSAVGASAGSYGCRLTSFGPFQKRYKNQAWRLASAPIPSAQIHSATGMSASPSAALGSVTSTPAQALQQRLSEQLQALSLVGETLTLRLLELEERLSTLEELMGNLQPSSESADLGSAAVEMLTATEDRIARLEELLGDVTPQRGVHAPTNVHPITALQPEETADAELELDPFPEDEEQPFMDELSA